MQHRLRFLGDHGQQHTRSPVGTTATLFPGMTTQRLLSASRNDGIDSAWRACMTIRLHRGDLPDLSRYRESVAIDTETMGLDHRRDRLCVVQLSPGDGSADLVRDVLGVDLSKQQQLTDWGAEKLTEAQVAYAASDVVHLHALRAKLDA